MVTFWHGGLSSVEGSQQMEAVVRGYDQAVGDPSPARRGIVDYAGGRPPPAPYASPFSFASQSFVAASDTITTVGLVVGNPKLPRGAMSPENSIVVRLCETRDCATGILATAKAEIVNYGITEAQLGDVAVTKDAKYFLYWQSPPKREGASWVTFWTGGGPQVEEATRLQAFARGYNRSGVPVTAAADEEQAGSGGVPTFADPHNASGEGTPIGALAFVEVSCKLFDPQIQSIEPDGYWYRIHSSPWDDRYYAAANAFWNGVPPGEGAEVVNTDFGVPDCEA